MNIAVTISSAEVKEQQAELNTLLSIKAKLVYSGLFSSLLKWPFFERERESVPIYFSLIGMFFLYSIAI